MKKLSLIFLILVLMSSVAFAQTPEKPEALIIDEFGRIPNGHFRSILDNFFVQLQNNPESRGLIISYGLKREVAAREKLIKNHISFRRFDDSRISFINGGHSNEIKTRFWCVPEGAENPKPEPTAFIFDDFGTKTNGEIKLRMDMFYNELTNNPTFQGYIINYGPKREISQRERMIRSYGVFRNFDSSRITFVNGGNTGKLKTVMWLVPEGVETPKP